MVCVMSIEMVISVDQSRPLIIHRMGYLSKQSRPEQISQFLYPVHIMISKMVSTHPWGSLVTKYPNFPRKGIGRSLLARRHCVSECCGKDWSLRARLQGALLAVSKDLTAQCLTLQLCEETVDLLSNQLNCCRSQTGITHHHQQSTRRKKLILIFIESQLCSPTPQTDSTNQQLRARHSSPSLSHWKLSKLYQEKESVKILIIDRSEFQIIFRLVLCLWWCVTSDNTIQSWGTFYPCQLLLAA